MVRSARDRSPSLPAANRTAGGPAVKTAGLPAAGRFAVFSAALAAVILWAGTPAVTKLAVGELDPVVVGVLRTLVGAVVAVPILFARRLAFPASAEARRLLAVSALGGFVVFPLVFSLGLERTSAGHGALAMAVLPIFTGLIAAAWDRRLPGRRWWLGAAIALAGTLLLIDRRFGLTTPGASLDGDLLVLLSCLGASAGYVAGARAAREAGTFAVTFWGLGLGGLVLVPVLPFLNLADALSGLSAVAWGSVAYLGVLSSIAAYSAWYWALAQGDIGRTGLVQFVQPFLALLLAVIVLGEALTWPLLLAGLVMVAGVALAQSEGRAAARR